MQSQFANMKDHLTDPQQTLVIRTMVLPADNGIVYLASDICKPEEDKRTRFISWEAVKLVKMISTRNCHALDRGKPPLG